MVFREEMPFQLYNPFYQSVQKSPPITHADWSSRRVNYTICTLLREDMHAAKGYNAHAQISTVNIGYIFRLPTNILQNYSCWINYFLVSNQSHIRPLSFTNVFIVDNFETMLNIQRF